jgi:hypothetical protein
LSVAVNPVWLVLYLPPPPKEKCGLANWRGE